MFHAAGLLMIGIGAAAMAGADPTPQAPSSRCTDAAATAKTCADVDYGAGIVLQGEVISVDWAGPNVWIALKLAKSIPDDLPGGVWRIRGSAPNATMRSGLNRESMRPGTVMIIKGYRFKDRACDGGCKAHGWLIEPACRAWVGMSSYGTGPRPPTCSDIAP